MKINHIAWKSPRPYPFISWNHLTFYLCFHKNIFLLPIFILESIRLKMEGKSEMSACLLLIDCKSVTRHLMLLLTGWMSEIMKWKTSLSTYKTIALENFKEATERFWCFTSNLWRCKIFIPKLLFLVYYNA